LAYVDSFEPRMEEYTKKEDNRRLTGIAIVSFDKENNG
jgi:hypothetical protein